MVGWCGDPPLRKQSPLRTHREKCLGLSHVTERVLGSGMAYLRLKTLVAQLGGPGAGLFSTTPPRGGGRHGPAGLTSLALSPLEPFQNLFSSQVDREEGCGRGRGWQKAAGRHPASWVGSPGLNKGLAQVPGVDSGTGEIRAVHGVRRAGPRWSGFLVQTYTPSAAGGYKLSLPPSFVLERHLNTEGLYHPHILGTAAIHSICFSNGRAGLFFLHASAQSIWYVLLMQNVAEVCIKDFLREMGSENVIISLGPKSVGPQYSVHFQCSREHYNLCRRSTFCEQHP